MKQNPDVAGKIEAQVRANSGVIADVITAGEMDSKDDDDTAAEA